MTNLSILDWVIVFVSIIGLRLVSLRTRSYMRGVADFLSANRSAGRYLLTIASQMGGVGVISVVGSFEMHYAAGFPPIWWGFMSLPVGVIILMSGWVFYRFRETRALTMAQFFEMRYSRKFRIYAGILAWTSGILNFGLFPAVAAHFFIYFCGLPEYFHIPGIPIAIGTFPVVMALDLAFALTFVNMGGQVSIMITECVQGIFSSIVFLIVIVAILMVVPWDRAMTALHQAPANASMLHPFKTGQVEDFNFWYFAIGVFSSFYGYMAWQGSSGFNGSARTPHEQRMGGVIAVWREAPRVLMVLLLPIAAYAVMRLPEFVGTATAVNQTLKQIGNPALQSQMQVPVVLANILPIGVKGLFATLMLFFSFTCHDTYIHSWGSIFVQDVVMPIRKKPLSPEQHIRVLRCAITGVAIFSFFFSLLYPQTLKILMFFAITGTIWLGGAGSVIIGGLYWNRGTTAGAYSALTLGGLLGVGGLIVPEMYKNSTGANFPISGQVLYFAAMVSAIIVYVVVSLLTSRNRAPFDLDRMLRRGKYATATEAATATHIPVWRRVMGINENFSRGDRILVMALFAWNGGWFLTFLGVTIANLFKPFSDIWWQNFWHAYVVLTVAIAVPATIWFAIGGVMDIRALLATLDVAVRDDSDDGRVVAYDADEETPEISLADQLTLGEPLHDPLYPAEIPSIPDPTRLPLVVEGAEEKDRATQ